MAHVVVVMGCICVLLNSSARVYTTQHITSQHFT